MSAATIDRRLAEDRRRLDSKGRSGAKPGSLLKRNIPIKTFSDWSDTVPGFVEIDLVGHDGGSVRGEYAQTLDVVDVATRWTETRAVKNNERKGSKVTKRYDKSKTPYQQVSRSAQVPQDIKDRLTTEYETLNPACLRRRLLALIRLLMRSCLPISEQNLNLKNVNVSAK